MTVQKIIELNGVMRDPDASPEAKADVMLACVRELSDGPDRRRLLAQVLGGRVEIAPTQVGGN